jgi:hypothetical protein
MSSKRWTGSLAAEWAAGRTPRLTEQVLLDLAGGVQRHTLHDDTYCELATRFSERQLVSLAFLVGSYSLLSVAFGAFRMELDPGLDPEDFDTYVNGNTSQKGN